MSAPYEPMPDLHPLLGSGSLPGGRLPVEAPASWRDDGEFAPCIRAAFATALGVDYSNTTRAATPASQYTVAAACLEWAESRGLVLCIHFNTRHAAPVDREWWIGLAVEVAEAPHAFVMHYDQLAHDPKPHLLRRPNRWCALTLDRHHVEGTPLRRLLEVAPSRRAVITQAVVKWRQENGEPLTPGSAWTPDPEAFKTQLQDELLLAPGQSLSVAHEWTRAFASAAGGWA